MKFNWIFLIVIFFSQTSWSQKIITVQSGINVSFHATIDSALANSNTGDQIYVPGGIYNVSNLVVNRSVMIFGAGHYPDSTVATSATTIVGNISLVTGSSGGLLTGCNVFGNIVVGTGIVGSDSVANYTISRCIFINLDLSVNGYPPTNARGFSINENIIKGSVRGANAPSIIFSKNIISGGINYFYDNSSFTNNDFIGLGNCSTLSKLISNVSSCTFTNNIFLFTPPLCPGAALIDSNCHNNFFANNLFTDSLAFPAGSNSGIGNIITQPVDSIYISATGNAFDYSSNYHLIANSPGINGATDGFNVGIYGTIQPYKEGAVPFNPHIQQKAIDINTNSQGQLNIQIRAAAQEF